MATQTADRNQPRVRLRFLLLGILAILIVLTWALGGFERGHRASGKAPGKTVDAGVYSFRLEGATVRNANDDESQAAEYDDGFQIVQMVVVTMMFRNESDEPEIDLSRAFHWSINREPPRDSSTDRYASADRSENPHAENWAESHNAVKPPGLWVPLTFTIPVAAEQIPVKKVEVIAYALEYRDRDNAWANVVGWFESEPVARLEVPIK